MGGLSGIYGNEIGYDNEWDFIIKIVACEHEIRCKLDDSYFVHARITFRLDSRAL